MSFRYQGQGPMPVVFFFSGGASSMKAALESPDHGVAYRVVGAVANRDKNEAPVGWEIADAHRVHVEYINPQDLPTREGFYQVVLDYVRETTPDIVGLSGFLYKYSLVDEPFLGAYANRIINVHPADLSILASIGERTAWDLGRMGTEQRKIHMRDYPYEHGVSMVKAGCKRLFTGDDPVAMAVLFGEKEVCSTIHSVTDVCDGGPILVQSKRLPVDTAFVDKMLARNALDRISAYAHELQGRMKTECDGPAFCGALRLLAEGRMGIGDDFVTLDGKTLPYCGHQLDSTE